MMKWVHPDVLHNSFQAWDHKNPRAPCYLVKGALMEKANGEALSKFPLPSVNALSIQMSMVWPSQHSKFIFGCRTSKHRAFFFFFLFR